MNKIVVLKNVGMSFSGEPIFYDVNMEITAGKIIALMGANGCGKSTLLRIIAGVLPNTDGEVIHSTDIKMAYIPDRFPKLPFKVKDYLHHMGEIQGVATKAIDEYINRMFKTLNIPIGIKNRNINNCSKGTVQKINIMQALITKPDLLLLDEPFSGLDEASLTEFIALLKNLAQDGTTIILSCHERAHAVELTEDVFVFEGGALKC